jgi:hypothetical protein
MLKNKLKSFSLRHLARRAIKKTLALSFMPWEERNGRLIWRKLTI